MWRMWRIWTSQWATITKIIAIYLSVAVISGLLGIIDVSGALTYGGRVRGALAVVASSILLLAACSVIAFAKWLGLNRYQGSAHTSETTISGTLTLIGAVVAIIVSTVLFLTQLRGGDVNGYLGLWLSLVLCSSWCLYRVIRWRIHIPYPKQVAVTGIASVILAVAGFTYSELYQPTVQPYAIEVTVGLDKPSISPDRTAASLPITVSIKNTGKVRVRVLGTSYSVVGRRATISKEDKTEGMAYEAVPQGLPMARTTTIQGFDLLQADRIVMPGDIAEPDAQVNIGRILQLRLPVHYDAIGISATAIVIRDDRATVHAGYAESAMLSWDETLNPVIDAPAWVAPPKTAFVRYQADISEGSVIRRITRRARQVTMWWVLAEPTLTNPSGPYVAAIIAPVGEEHTAPSPKRSKELEERYGLSYTHSGLYEQSVWALDLPTPRPPPSARNGSSSRETR
jgi:hypothetical protein